MKTLVIYDSVFGNTKMIAEAITLGLNEDAKALHVSEATKDFEGIGLLIVGSPTRGFRPTPAITAFLKSIPAGKLDGIKIAAFDTRMDIKKVNNKFLTFMVKLSGYAVEKIEKQLIAKGGTSLGTEWFCVSASEGPLLEGETDRAASWAGGLVK
ncbi:MAG: flavodoxin family protein [Erysipelotrichaceae bacterium]